MLTKTNLLLIHHSLYVPKEGSLTVLACIRLQPLGSLKHILVSVILVILLIHATFSLTKYTHMHNSVIIYIYSTTCPVVAAARILQQYFQRLVKSDQKG